MGLKNVKFQLLPKTLDFLEEYRRVEVSQAKLTYYSEMMNRIITGGETRIYAYDPKTTD